MESVCKFYKEEKFVSYDEGQTWSSYGDYRKGEIYETDSLDCMTKQYRIVPVEGNYICDGKDKYVKGIKQYTVDGLNWYNDYPTTYVALGDPVEVDSQFCDNKYVGHYGAEIVDYDDFCRKEYGPYYRYVDGVGCRYLPYVDPIKTVKCNDSPILTQDEVNFIYYLDEAYVGDCVTTIGENAFNSLSSKSLFSINLPSTIERMENGSFRGCALLKEINIPTNTNYIGNYAFDGCSNIRHVSVPSGATLGDGVFQGCTSMEWSVIPSAPKEVHKGCTSLTSVTFNNTVTSIGTDAFSGCSSLSSITIPNTVTSIGYDAFSDCTSFTSMVMPDSVTSIGWGIFSGCTNLQTAVLSNSLTSISQNAFRGCTSLASITIPTNVTSIGGWAFYGCTSLTSLTIPTNVTSIAWWAFSGCTSLTSITCRSITPPLLQRWNDRDEGVFDNTSCSIFVPCDSINEYVKDYSGNGWSFWRRYAERIFPIETSCNFDYAFKVTYNNGYVHKAPRTYYLITSNLLSYDKKTKDDVVSLNLNSGYFTIGYARILSWIGITGFDNCKNLSNLIIESDCLYIANNAFNGCTSLKTLEIPSTVRYIKGGAFANCDLTSVYLPNTPITIESGVFASNEHLEEIVLPNLCSFRSDDTHLTPIDCTFDMNIVNGCTSLTAITIGGLINNIQFDGNSGLVSLKSLTITCGTPPSLTNYADNNFPNLVVYVPNEYYDAYMNSDWDISIKRRIQPIP